EPYYTVNIGAGHGLADDFQRRSTAAGWTAEQRSRAYDHGRGLERAEIGIVMDLTGMTPQEARRRLRHMFPRLKRRCQDLARDVPGAVSDVEAGDRPSTRPPAATADDPERLRASSYDRSQPCC